MRNATELETQTLARVEAALRADDFRPPPPDFTRNVMAHIGALAPRPRFALSWLDYALGLLAVLMIGMISLAVVFIPEHWFIQARLQWLIWRHSVNAYVPILWLVLGVLLAGAIFLVLAGLIFFARPHPARLAQRAT